MLTLGCTWRHQAGMTEVYKEDMYLILILSNGHILGVQIIHNHPTIMYLLESCFSHCQQFSITCTTSTVSLQGLTTMESFSECNIIHKLIYACTYLTLDAGLESKLCLDHSHAALMSDPQPTSHEARIDPTSF